MARDLTRETSPRRNGAAEAAAIVDAALPGPEPAQDETSQVDMGRYIPTHTERLPEPTTELLTARRDWMLARVALMLIDAAKLLDPITRIVLNRVLALAALGSAVGICVYTISRTAGWERVATAGLFVVLASWLIRKGQQ
ncbi:MAG: hypothetical protein V4515_15210 [Chloroflexota bacterium]